MRLKVPTFVYLTLLAACETPIGPTPDVPRSALRTGAATDTPATPEPEAASSAICGMTVKRSAIEEVVTGLRVRIRVPVDYRGPGTPFVSIWLPAVNAGDKKGPYRVVDGVAVAEFSVSTYGRYEYQVAVELDFDGDSLADGDCQDDRHHGSFDVRRASTTTTTSATTTTTTAPSCKELNPPTFTVEGPALEPNGFTMRAVVTFFNKGGSAMLYCGDRRELACKYPYVHCGESSVVTLRGRSNPGETCWVEVEQ